MLVNFLCFCCRMPTFLFKINFFKKKKKKKKKKKNIQEHDDCQIFLGPDQDRRSVGCDLGPNYLKTMA